VRVVDGAQLIDFGGGGRWRPASASAHTKIELVPGRTYSQSSSRSCPGRAGIGSRRGRAAGRASRPCRPPARPGRGAGGGRRGTTSLRATNSPLASGGIVGAPLQVRPRPHLFR
jgi:hypothetical protein